MGKAALAALLIAGAGCHKLGSEAAASVSEAAPILEVHTLRKDMGLLQLMAPVRETFTFRNRSGRHARLSMGTPSCSCLEAKLQPLEELAPGERGSLTLALNTSDRGSAGLVEGSVILAVAGTSESYLFTLSGIIEGIAAHSSYVVRPSDFQNRELPKLRFAVISREGDAPFQITSITCHEVLYDEEARRPDRLVGRGPLIKGLTVRPDKLEIHAPLFLTQDQVYSREVEIPVEGSAPPNTLQGEVVIRYRLRGEEKVAIMKLVLLTS